MRFLRRRHHMSPLILFIFITSFSSVLSRHRIRHHRDRFKRQQGAHLFLAGSYVYDGGEGPDAGPWTDWSSPSPCSRSCGGGVSTETRQCTPGYMCQGPTTRHFSCNTQDCPDIGDFRAQQCSEFDSVPFSGVQYQWIPYTKAPNPCELNCMPRGERFYYRYRDRVVDGTRCNDESVDVCIQGKCQPVGCDMMLGSSLREDRCRRCGGDGSTCNTVTGRLDMQDLQPGYNDILLIPAGATNILVQEITPSNNYLAVRNTSGHYYLNGHWKIDFPRPIDIAGCKFRYERNPHGFSAPDTLQCLGPTDEALFIVLLIQDRNVGVDYEYSLPTNIQPGYETESYAWTFDQFSPCSQTCGGGVQYRNVTCAGRRTLEPADESLCDSNNKPATTQKCAEIACEAQWVPYPWGNCSEPCGEGGIQTREIACQQIISNGYPSLVEESECAKLQPKPPQQQTCNKGRICAKWHIGPWKPCDRLCGDGKEVRKVRCYRKEGTNIEIMDESECTAIERKPETEKKCNLRPCEGVDWITSSWSGCDKCGLTNETRKVQCATAAGQIHPDTLCEVDRKPEMVRQCNATKAACEYLWYASQWSECSAQCGQGVQTRTLFCGVVTEDGSVKKVENDKCNNGKTYETIKNCTGEVEKCAGEWFSGPWNECSKPCGGGERSRKVVCLKDLQVVDASECGPDQIIFGKEECNTQPCSEDTIIPTDVTKTVDESETDVTGVTEVTDMSTTSETKPVDEEEYEIVQADECDDGEWVDPEEILGELKLPTKPMGEDKLGSSTESSVTKSKETEFSMDDLMFSDAAAPDESESTVVTGSGDEALTSVPSVETSPSFTESTFEGSGDTSGTDSSIITDIIETDTPIILESSPSLTSEPVASTEGVSESTDGSVSTESSVSSGSSERTESSVPTGSSGVSVGSTESTNSGVSSESTESTDSGVSSTGTESTDSGVSSGNTESTDRAVSSESTESTESGKSSESSESTDGDVSTDSSVSTDANKDISSTGSTDISESTGSSVESSDITTESSTGLSSGASDSSEMTTDSSDVSTGASDLTTESSDLTSSSDLATKASDLTTESSSDSSSSSISEGTSESASTDSTVTESTDTTESTDATETTSSTETSLSSESSGTTESSATESSESSSSSSASESSLSTDVSTSDESTTLGVTFTTESGTTIDAGSTEVTTAGTQPSQETEEPEQTFIGESDFGAAVATTTRKPTAESSDLTTETSGAETTTQIGGSSEASTGISDSSEASTGVSGSSEATSGVSGSTEAVTEISTSTEAITEVSGTTAAATEISITTAEVTEISGSTEAVTAISGSTEAATGISVSTEMVTEIVSSTEAATKVSGSSGATTQAASSTEAVSSEATTEGASMSTMVSTEPAAGTKSTTEFTGSTETPVDVDIWTTTTESGGISETTSSDLWETTSIIDIFATKKPRMCKRRKQKTCKQTKYGCCWDNITPAQGPFDKGCPNPKTCKESKFGCCEDGVSPALGKNFEGCPSTHCNETLFGCCPDNKTIAEGNNNEGCPPPPPACLASEYGCCLDNITAAEGPDYEGCEEELFTSTTSATSEVPIEEDCSNSTYGCCPDGVHAAEGEFYKGCVLDNCNQSYFRCCPDGVTFAEGPNYQGCKMPCSDSDFGCCPDGTTPAHGYSGEGCCLASPHGCCPDNILPARGPNLEGCGCQYSPYRCCPDNVTAARGYNNEGCGCQYTEHGCCPDAYTPAAGPDYKGCLCHTFQFGCCPDGVTVAKGPHQQGCGCRNTEFGCCSDDSTPAQGPNLAGCGCDSSKYGCCPDGVKDAQGDGFEGCEDIPADLQESCTQPKERGTCRNYTVKWFFDMDYGGCSRFWYGGCDGNDNRFRSKEECDGICVKPEGTDRCKLPKIPGPCEGYYPQWYYDKERKHCAQFVYGGCLGNNNRFETRDECLALCMKDDSVDACEQDKDEGPCRGNYIRWYFDKERGSCLQFVYGGCKANNNNFPTEEACKQQCAQPGRKKDHCSLPRAQGNCTEREPRWYYDKPEKQCLPFYYSGCNGNNNNFNSREACEADCPKEIEKDLCQLPADIGTCGNYSNRWYFDTREKACRQFYYGGCGGNGNNFQTQQQCEQRCDRRQTPVPVTEPPAPDHVTATDQVTPAQVPPDQEPFVTDMCFLPSETGNCRASDLRYFYDRADGVCKRFTYGGCGGNRNNFVSVEECFQNCGNAQDLCSLPPIVGPCNAEYQQYYYDARTDSCQSFTYGGCEGNYNRFSDKASCEQRCKRAVPTQEPLIQTRAPPGVEQPASTVAMCYEQPDSGSDNCTDNLSVFFFDSSSRVCTPFTYTGCGGNGNRFTSEEQCERQCGSFRGLDVCNTARDPGPCRGYFVKYYYDKGVGRCAQFAYGGCGGTGNRFSSNEECESICMTHEEKRTNVTSTAVCELSVDTGSCQDGYHKRWYFDNARGECIAFIFSGCGGNLNNFKTFQSCVEFCKDYLTVTQPPASPEDHPCQAHFDECATLRCPYGIEAYVDDNQCNRCQCQNPCSKVDCPADSQCAIDINRNKTSSEDPDFIAICREINKEGQCPNLEHHEETNCEHECRNDADCPLQLKCCSAGCGTSCIEPLQPPGELVTQQPLPGYTEPPIQSDYHAPRIDMEKYEPEVRGLIGDHVTLRCAVTGNPDPKIAWKKDNLLIDGTQAKYRIKLDQSLQIITLHKTDAGVYLCTADNSIGEPVTNQIKLDVLDSEPRPATVLEPEDQPNVVVSLNAPATLNCLALGYPFPAVTWWKDDSLIPLKTSQFEVRKDYSLLIHSVKLSNLGIYTCQAYNGVGKAASWSVAVKARGPYYSTNPRDQKYLKYLVNPPEPPTTLAPPIPQYTPQRHEPVYRPSPPPYLPPANNEISPNRERPEQPPPTYLVPVRTNITSQNQRFPTNADVSIPCVVDGFPEPQVQWYKDGVPINPSNRIHISGSYTLTIMQATKADSGTYQCEAANAYSKSSSSIAILIDAIYIHPNCKDNRFFANCNLIVKAQFCSHKYYAKFCCRSCTEAGLLPVDGPHLSGYEKQSALSNNLV